jgi:hypothetical protein
MCQWLYVEFIYNLPSWLQQNSFFVPVKKLGMVAARRSVDHLVKMTIAIMISVDRKDTV